MSTKTSPLEKIFHKPDDPRSSDIQNIRHDYKSRQNSIDATKQINTSPNYIPQNIINSKPGSFLSIGAQSSISTHYRTKYSLELSKSLLNEQTTAPNSQNAFTNQSSRSGTPITTPKTTPRSIRSLTPTTIQLNSPNANLSTYHHQHHHLTTRRETTPLVETTNLMDISFGNDLATLTASKKQPSRASTPNTKIVENVPKQKRSISVFSSTTGRSGFMRSADKKVSVTRPNSPRFVNVDQTTKDNLELMRRERELRRIIQEFDLPRWLFSKDHNITQRENLAKELLSRQITEDLKMHEESHTERTAKRMEVNEDSSDDDDYNEPAADPRDALFTKLELDTKYPHLKHKIIDHILDTDELKKSRDKILRRRFRERKAAISYPPKIQVDPSVNFNEKKLKLQNMYKSVPLSDLKFKKQFDNWFDDELEGSVFRKMDFLTKYHSINFSLRYKKKFKKDIISSSFTDGTKFDPSLLTHSDDEGDINATRDIDAPLADADINNSDSSAARNLFKQLPQKADSKIKHFQAAARKASFLSINPAFSRDPEIRKWMMYLRSFRFTEIKPDGSIRYITHHPKEYSQRYWDFLKRRREIQEKAGQKDRSPKKLFKIIFAKIRAANAFKAIAKKEHNFQRSKRLKELQPETIQNMNNTKREIFRKYQLAYSHLKWDNKLESRYRAARGLTKSVLPVGSLGCANAITSFEFFKYDKSIKNEMQKVKEGEYEQKRNFYFLNSNPYNRKRIQEELDLVDKATLKKYELEVSNQVIAEYHNNKEQLQERRVKFLQKEKWKKSQKQKEIEYKLKKEEQIRKHRDEHKRFTNHIRRLLEATENKTHSPKPDDDDRFMQSDLYKRIKGNYSKINNLSKIAEASQEKRNQIRDMNTAMGTEIYVYGQRKLQVSCMAENSNISFNKMHRMYSGGPRLLVPKKTVTQSKMDKELAIIKVQAAIRGLLSRIRYRRELEIKKLEAAPKKSKRLLKKNY